MEKAIDWLSPSKSFYTRVVLILLPFTVFVCVLYSLFIRASIQFVEDQIITDYLQTEWQAITVEYGVHQSASVLPNTSYITSFTESDPLLPQAFKGLSIGTYEFVHDDAEQGEFPRVISDKVEFNHEEHDYHLLIDRLSPDGEKIYLLLNENKLSSINQYENFVQSIIYAIAGVVIIMGSLLAITLARFISQPIQALNSEVSQSDWQNTQFKSQSRQDEIGTLANGFSNLLERLKESIEREKAFTRHASHELRTPLTVASNAISVLGLPSISAEKRMNNLQRLKQSMTDMDGLIEVFLLLGRSESEYSTQPLQLRPILDSCIKKYAHQLECNQTFEMHIDDNEIPAHESILKVLLDNLIRNSIFHGAGTVNIIYDGSSLNINNHCKESDQGYGYGLEIVQRICEAMNWNLSIKSENGVFNVTIGILA